MIISVYRGLRGFLELEFFVFKLGSLIILFFILLFIRIKIVGIGLVIVVIIMEYDCGLGFT